jgi:hypothetical protein
MSVVVGIMAVVLAIFGATFLIWIIRYLKELLGDDASSSIVLVIVLLWVFCVAYREARKTLMK